MGKLYANEVKLQIDQLSNQGLVFFVFCFFYYYYLFFFLFNLCCFVCFWFVCFVVFWFSIIIIIIVFAFSLLFVVFCLVWFPFCFPFCFCYHFWPCFECANTHSIQPGSYTRIHHVGVGAFICESLLSCAGQIPLPPGYLHHAYKHVRQAGFSILFKSTIFSILLFFCRHIFLSNKNNNKTNLQSCQTLIKQ